MQKNPQLYDFSLRIVLKAQCSNTAPSHPHATGVAVYPALFLLYHWLSDYKWCVGWKKRIIEDNAKFTKYVLSTQPPQTCITAPAHLSATTWIVGSVSGLQYLSFH